MYNADVIVLQFCLFVFANVTDKCMDKELLMTLPKNSISFYVLLHFLCLLNTKI